MRKTNYVIVPINDYASEPIKAGSPEEALEEFAFQMDYDMSQYFKAIPEKEYKKETK